MATAQPIGEWSQNVSNLELGSLITCHEHAHLLPDVLPVLLDLAALVDKLQDLYPKKAWLLKAPPIGCRRYLP
jgi:hypothetical protein